MPTISVIIATRNRPGLFGEALQSVLRQTAPPVEIIVVNDGSDDKHREAYARLLGEAGDRVRSHWLVTRPRGHGQSYALNFGVAQAKGDYVGFLDDDDTWTDFGHLARAGAVIESSSSPVDLYMTNQGAYLNGEQRPGPIWIEDLGGFLRNDGRQPERSGAYAVTLADLLRCSGFCHLNTLIVRRQFYEDAGGMDENIRWECDHDLVLRLMDRAHEIRYAAEFVARHNIPDPAARSSMTTTLSDYERRLYQLRVFDRAALFSTHPELRAYGRRHKAYALKKIAEGLTRDGRAVDAAFYAREALGAGPTWKWAIYTMLRTIQALGRSPFRRPLRKNSQC